jgi:hypothetical protein
MLIQLSLFGWPLLRIERGTARQHDDRLVQRGQALATLAAYARRSDASKRGAVTRAHRRDERAGDYA